MTETMPLMFNYAFENCKFHRIEDFVDAENSKCKKVLDKLNFNFKGTMCNYEVQNGALISIEIYSKLAGV